MICYRDMCFCSSKTCLNKWCRRRITQEVEADAERLGLPIDVADIQESCTYYECSEVEE